jgi:hypothetical protein
MYDNSLAVLQLVSTCELHLNWELATLQFVHGIGVVKSYFFIFRAPLLLFTHEKKVQFRNFYFCNE